MVKLSVAVCTLLVSLLSFMPAPALAVLEVQGGLMDMTQPGWDNATAGGINEAGDVVGAYTSGTVTRGFLRQGDTYTTIHPPGAGWTMSELTDINNGGDIIGYGTKSGVTTGFVYSGGIYTEYPPAPGTWTNFKPASISENGLIVGGGTETLSGDDKAFIIDGGVITAIPLPAGFSDAQATGVNNAGTVVGYGTKGSDNRGFLWDGFTNIEITPSGWTASQVAAINENGVILGSGTDGTVGKCFLFESGTFNAFWVDSWLLTSCLDFNDNFDILGLGYTPGLNRKAFVYRRGEFYAFDGDDEYTVIPAAINNALNFVGYGLVTPTAFPFLGELPPHAELTVNGKTGPISVGSNKTVTLEVMLAPLTLTGVPADWWLIGATPDGNVSYSPRARGWVSGISPVVQKPLKYVKPTKIAIPTGRSPGLYTYYVGVDLNADGKLTIGEFFFDSVTMYVR